MHRLLSFRRLCLFARPLNFRIVFLFSLFVVNCVSSAARAGDALFYSDSTGTLSKFDPVVFIDARHASECRDKTLPDAICLPPSQLMHPDGTLASLRDINWLFGTLGIDENATTVVFGNSPNRAEFDPDSHFVASLLYLMGQKRVTIWSQDPAQLLNQQRNVSGVSAGLLRQHFYQATLRDEQLLLDSDVRQFFAGAPAERLTLADFSDAEVYARSDGARLVLAATTRQALTAFARLLATSATTDTDQIGVHVSGLQGRSATELGAPKKVDWYFIAGALIAIVLCSLAGFILVRRSEKTIRPN